MEKGTVLLYMILIFMNALLMGINYERENKKLVWLGVFAVVLVIGWTAISL